MTTRTPSLINCYELLNIAPSASLTEIKAAYRRLAYRYHPDRNPGNPEAENRLKEVIAAYDKLCEGQGWDVPSEQSNVERSDYPDAPKQANRNAPRRNQDNTPDSGMYSSFIYAMTGNPSLR